MASTPNDTQPSASGANARAVPHDWKTRLGAEGLNFLQHRLAVWIAEQLDGRHPKNSRAAATLRTAYTDKSGYGFDPADVDAALAALERAGYGQHHGRKARRLRDHGTRLATHPNVDGVLGKLPRRFALRAPRTANNRMAPERRGLDTWGEVSTNHVLRSIDIGLVAYVGGLYMSANPQALPHVNFTLGQAAYTLAVRRREVKHVSGKDLAEVAESLARLAGLQLNATGGDEAYQIDSGPFARVCRRWGEEWIELDEYAERVLALPAGERPPAPADETVRVYLADWFIGDLAHDGNGRRVIVNFDVFRQISPFARCLYVYLQALGPAKHDPDSVSFYLADRRGPRFTLGLTAKRQDRTQALVQLAIRQLYSVDSRITGYAKVILRPGTNCPVFTVHVARAKPSRARHPDRVGKVFDWTQRLGEHEFAEIVKRVACEGSPRLTSHPPPG